MHVKAEKILVSGDEIARRVRELGREITSDYTDREILMVCILKGAVVFTADLMRQVNRPVSLDFVAVSSYGDSTSSTGVVKIIKDMDQDMAGRHVILVEDIVDTGLTLNYLKELLTDRHPESLAICAMFDKPSRRRVDIEPDYVGMTIPDHFVVGYGLDYQGQFRNLPDLRILSEQEQDAQEERDG